MGTRSLTIFHDGDARQYGKEIAVLYRQYDGCPDGHGKELADFLEDKPIVNGISTNPNVFNGMGCLAAAVVAHFKDGAGGFYLYPAGTRDCGEEYTYHISGKAGDKQATIRTEEN